MATDEEDRVIKAAIAWRNAHRDFERSFVLGKDGLANSIAAKHAAETALIEAIEKYEKPYGEATEANRP